MNMNGHTLYETGDPDAPQSILDSNGEVTLGLCKVCGAAEIQLQQPCTVPRQRATTVDIVRKLQACHVKAKQLNEQLEALAAECCRVLLVDPERESIERDWCEEIVYHGADPALVYSRIKSSRRGELESSE